MPKKQRGCQAIDKLGVVHGTEGGFSHVPTPRKGNSVMTGPWHGGWKLEVDHSHAKQKCDVVTVRAMNCDLAAGGHGSTSLTVLKGRLHVLSKSFTP